jgi:hypothetical protein
MADGLIKAGISPLDILKALHLDASYVDAAEKLYNELEPRVPAGSGTISGEWTLIVSFLAELTAPQAERLGVLALGLMSPEAAAAAAAVAAYGVMFIPSPNRIRVEGEISGLPGARYSWNRDEAQLHLTYETAGGEQRTFTRPS